MVVNKSSIIVPWPVSIIPRMFIFVRSDSTCSRPVHMTTIKNVLATEAFAIPSKSDIPTYRHHPRYCLKRPKTISLTGSINSSMEGYFSMSHSLFRLMLFVSRNATISAAANITMCVRMIITFLKRSITHIKDDELSSVSSRSGIWSCWSSVSGIFELFRIYAMNTVLYPWCQYESR